jgi:hypothetical protein
MNDIWESKGEAPQPEGSAAAASLVFICPERTSASEFSPACYLVPASRNNRRLFLAARGSVFGSKAFDLQNHVNRRDVTRKTKERWWIRFLLKLECALGLRERLPSGFHCSAIEPFFTAATLNLWARSPKTNKSRLQRGAGKLIFPRAAQTF